MISFFFSICFSFLSLSLLVSMFLRSVLRFSFLSASHFISPLPLVFICSLYFSAVCIPPRFGCRLQVVHFLGYLPANPPSPPLPPLSAFAVLVFLTSPPDSLRFLSDSLPLALVLVLSPSRVFSLSLVTLLQGCLSVLVRIHL